MRSIIAVVCEVNVTESLSSSYWKQGFAMNILMLVQLFETPEDNGSDRNYFFAKELVKKGNKVKVITSNIDYKKASKRFDTKASFTKQYSGVDVLYAPVYSNFRGSYFKRVIFYISFILSSFIELIKSSKTADLIYGVSTPLTVPFICAIVAKLRKLPFIFEVTDVWPDAAVHSGILKNKIVIFIAQKIEFFCYKNATHIICLTEGIENNIKEKGISSLKISLVTNGVDLDLFRTIDSDKTIFIKSSLGLSNKFVAMYLGAHGKYNALDTIVKSAMNLKDDKDIMFVFVGDGEEKSILERMVSEQNLSNVLFLSSVNRTRAVEILSVADCFLLPNLAGDFFKGNLPNKLFDYLASARPIIVSGHVESADLVKKIDAGFVLDAEAPDQLSNAIKNLSSMTPEERNLLGENGSVYVRRHYDRKKHVEQVSHIFTDALYDF
jgi:glycosyltransferase involved in cell wall biosynthesis